MRAVCLSRPGRCRHHHEEGAQDAGQAGRPRHPERRSRRHGFDTVTSPAVAPHMVGPLGCRAVDRLCRDEQELIVIFHPNLRLFGQLELLEVYDFYDAPVLVSCRTPTGAIYLAVAVRGSEHSEEWLYVSLSQERFADVRSGVIDLHIAFSQPEDGVTFLVDIPHDPSADALVKPLTPDQLDDDILPSRGELLRPPTETNIEYDAAAEKREIWVVVKLVGANLDKKTFEVWSVERDDHYAGRVAEEAVNSVNGAVLGKTYRAWLSQTAKRKPASGDMQEETVLLQLEDVS